jgi:ABC-type multidrug transport system fused ATPase/permease subunit
VVFQDFNQYQLTAARTSASAIPARVEDEARDRGGRSANGGATEVVAGLPAGLDTQLGRWFHGGVELSGGQWQRIAWRGRSCAATPTS